MTTSTAWSILEPSPHQYPLPSHPRSPIAIYLYLFSLEKKNNGVSSNPHKRRRRRSSVLGKKNWYKIMVCRRRSDSWWEVGGSTFYGKKSWSWQVFFQTQCFYVTRGRVDSQFMVFWPFICTHIFGRSHLYYLIKSTLPVLRGTYYYNKLVPPSPKGFFYL